MYFIIIYRPIWDGGALFMEVLHPLAPCGKLPNLQNNGRGAINRAAPSHYFAGSLFIARPLPTIARPPPVMGGARAIHGGSALGLRVIMKA